MVTLWISYQLDANSQLDTFPSTYPNERNITPAIFNPGNEIELASEAPFIAQHIWKDINYKTNRQPVLRSSVSCDMDFGNGIIIHLPVEIINANHNASVLNSNYTNPQRC